MRVLFCGSRGWHDPAPINALLAGLDVLSEGADEKLTVILSDAPGLVRKLAHQWGAEVIEESADGSQHNQEAGALRNQKMLDTYKPEAVYALRSAGKSNGTDDMIERATAAKVPTYVIEDPRSRDAAREAVEEKLKELGVDLGEESYYGTRRREIAEACIEAYRNA